MPTAASAGAHCPRCLMELALQPTAASTAARAAVPAPTVAELQPLFPAYELQVLLGRGGMGFVYRARHRKLDRLVAIKVLRPDIGADAAFAERFEREARALALLSHPGIVGIHDFGRAGDFFHLVMEYVDGANLRELLVQGQLTTRDVLAFVPQLCDALQYAHDHRIVHRDIKPENILVDQDGRVRIADFGLAKLLVDDPAAVGLTQSDQAVGTPHYMAPEQIVASGAVDHRADLYSLGVVLYEMLTGRLPIGRFQPPSAQAVAAAGFDPVVMKSLENDPALRYQRADEVKADVHAAARTAAAAPVPAGNAPDAGHATAAQARQTRSTTLRQHEIWPALHMWVAVACLMAGVSGLYGIALVVYLALWIAGHVDLPRPAHAPLPPGAPRPLPWAYFLGGLVAIVAAGMRWSSFQGSGSANFTPVPYVGVLDMTATNGSVMGIPLVVVPLLAVLVAIMGCVRAFGFGVPNALMLGAQGVGLLLPLVLLGMCAYSAQLHVGPGPYLTVWVFLFWLVLEVQRHAANSQAGTRRRTRA